jgi:hypothetical protein
MSRGGGREVCYDPIAFAAALSFTFVAVSTAIVSSWTVTNVWITNLI